MRLSKKLAIIGEVVVGDAAQPLASSAFQIRLDQHAEIFSEILYLGPSAGSRRSFSVGNVHYVGTDRYSKSWTGRLCYWARRNDRHRLFREALSDFSPDVVEIRIPSVFSLLAFQAVAGLQVPMTTYIAGDWESAISVTHSSPIAAFVGKFLDRLQWPLIRQSIPVTAGEALAVKYSFLNECHIYRSTTHNAVIERPICVPPRRIIYLGRLEPRKRVSDLVEAMAILCRSEPNYHLKIVGDGPEEEALHRLVNDLKLDDQVEFTGYIHDAAHKRQLLLESDILVLPSLSEGSPKVLPEAMAHGLLTIAVAGVGSIDAIIEDKVNGRLVRPGEPGHIAALIEELSGSPERFRAIVEAGYAYARQHTLRAEVERQWSYVARRLNWPLKGPGQ